MTLLTCTQSKRGKFNDLGFARWIPRRGLQIQNLELLEPDSPGVYVMHDQGVIYKIGKSSVSLSRRLKRYKGFDSDRMTHEITGDASSRKQRKAIKTYKLTGLHVHAVVAEKQNVSLGDGLGLMNLDINLQRWSFDAHDLERKLLEIAKAEGHQFEFGS